MHILTQLTWAVSMRRLSYYLAQISFHIARHLPLLTFAHLCCSFHLHIAWLFLLFRNLGEHRLRTHVGWLPLAKQESRLLELCASMDR